MEIIVAVVAGILVGSVVGGAACWWVQGSRAKSRQSSHRGASPGGESCTARSVGGKRQCQRKFWKWPRSS